MESENQEEVTITYETLFELLRREKERSELQKLDSNFFQNVIGYLKDKQTIISNLNGDNSSLEEKRKIEDQLYNVVKIIKDLYGRREKKIVSMAIDKSKNKSSIVDNSIFLAQENELFNHIVKVLDEGRENILLNVINMKEPSSLGEVSTGGIVSEKPRQVIKKEVKEPKDTQLVRFLSAVPKFVGRELEEYGPFDEEDIASLPIEIAKVLVNKGRAEVISED